MAQDDNFASRSPYDDGGSAPIPRRDPQPAALRSAVFDSDEVQGVLSGRFYSARAERERAPESEKPTHYKVICISMYTKDLAHLDELVGQLKARGMTKANRSALIRAALDQVDLDRVPRGI